jgi:xanthine dehydrogenase small subunit
VPIVQAGVEMEADRVERLDQRYPPAAMLQDFADIAYDAIVLTATDASRERRFYGPQSLDGALSVLAKHPEATIVAGATDIGVQINKGKIDPDGFLDLNRVGELTGVTIEDDLLTVGARVTWTELEEVVRERVPEFHEIISIFGAPQIRHVGTLGGNVINASPIADSLPFLFVTEAELELRSAAGTRRVGITDFYQGYKQLDMRPGELLTTIRIPLPKPEQTLRLYKVSRRRDLDISTFTAAIMLEIAGNTIVDARIALGAVGPTVLRARETEAFLRDQPLSEATMRTAGDVADGRIMRDGFAKVGHRNDTVASACSW